MRAELEALLRAGELKGVLQRVSEITANEDQGHPEIAWAFVTGCKAAAHLGEWQDSIALAERGLERQPDAEPAGWLHFYLGTSQMYVGDPRRALENLLAFEDTANKAPALQRLLPDWRFNLGFAYRLAGHLDTAIGAFQQAAALYQQVGRFNRVIVCHEEVAWSYLMKESLAEALPYINMAQKAQPEHGDPHSGAYLVICQGLYHLLGNEPDRARHYCSELLQQPDLTPGQRADGMWILGRLAQRSGDLDEARRLANLAYQSALREWWPPQLQRIGQLLDSLQQAS